MYYSQSKARLEEEAVDHDEVAHGERARSNAIGGQNHGGGEGDAEDGGLPEI